MNQLIPVYVQAPFKPVRAQGSVVWDADDKNYIDLAGGVAATPLGHCHPELIATVQQQAQQLWHISNFYAAPATLRLADELVKRTFADRVFFANSGTEAVEAAVKIARHYHWKTSRPPQGNGNGQGAGARSDIVCFSDSFHGRSLLGIALGNKALHRQGFSPLPPGITHLPFNQLQGLKQAISPRTTAAVLVEPVLGEAGVITATDDFLRTLRQLCDQTGTLLIFDEVQSGNGRTGPLYRYMATGVEPDLLATAKGLANGLPIGAVLAREAVAQTMEPGSHGSTFGGNPLVCAVALRTLQLLQSDSVRANSAERTEQLHTHLTAMGDNSGLFQQVRTQGMWAGCELSDRFAGRAGELQSLCWQQGVLVLPAGNGNVLRLAPALNITEQELSEGLQRLTAACMRLST